MTANRVAPWKEDVVEGVADVLGDTDTGLTGTQIAKALAALGPVIASYDPGSQHRKSERLRIALINGQRRTLASNHIVAFIIPAMSPVRYRENPQLRTLRQDELNQVLAFEGL